VLARLRGLRGALRGASVWPNVVLGLRIGHVLTALCAVGWPDTLVELSAFLSIYPIVTRSNQYANSKGF